MNVCRSLVSIGMMLNVAVLVRAPSAFAQSTPPKNSQPVAAVSRDLTGDDAKRADELSKAATAAMESDRFNDAIGAEEEYLALIARALDSKHPRSVNAEWTLKTLRRVAKMPKEDRVAYVSSHKLTAEGKTLFKQGKFGEAQARCEKALEIRHRLLTDDNPDTAGSYGDVARSVDAQGKYSRAQPLHEKALEINRRLLGDDNRETAAGCVNLASNLTSQGKYIPAQTLYEQALVILRGLLTDDHPDVAAVYNNIAVTLDHQGLFVEAQTRHEKALEIRRRLLGDNHRETAISYSNVASNLDYQARYAQAQQLHDQALEILRRLLTDDHPDTAVGYNNLASNLSKQGHFAQAQPLYKKALEIRRRVLTDEHPDTAVSYNNLASNLAAQGKYALAQPLYEKALTINRRLLTDKHPATAGAYGNLAFNLAQQGKYGESQPLYERAIELHRGLLGDSHPATATVFDNMANNLCSQGKYVQAEAIHRKALEIRRHLLTDDHPFTATCYDNLAIDLGEQGRYAEAQPLFEKALEIRRRALGDDHRETGISYQNLAQNLRRQRKNAAAEPLFEKALDIHRRVLGEGHPDTAACYSGLAGNLSAQAKYGQAEPLLEKALEINRLALTDNHPDTVRTYNDLAGNLHEQEKYAQAQPFFEKALEIDRRLLTDDNPDTARAYLNLATNFRAQGKYDQAEALDQKSLEIHRRLLTDNHESTGISYNNLAFDLYAKGKYREAQEGWLNATRSFDAVRTRFAFSGIDRAESTHSARVSLAAVSARLGQPEVAWRWLEEDLGRGLLDELAARENDRLTPEERARLRELTGALDRLDRVVESTPKELDQADRAQRFADLKRQRELASIALGEFQTKLVNSHGASTGQVAGLNEIQAVLPANSALLGWVDVDPIGPNSAEASGDHWAVVVRSKGVPNWVSIPGTGPNGVWTREDKKLSGRVRTELRKAPPAGSADVKALLTKLRAQRLDPLAKVLDGTARRLIILPSRAIAGIPIEALFDSEDTRTVSYSPSATVFKYLREPPRPDRHAGLLALGDPIFGHPERSGEPLPVGGLLLNVVLPGSNAATHGLKAGDVLLIYNGQKLNKKDDLKIVDTGAKPIFVGVWREGRLFRRELAPGKLGVLIDQRPAPEAITANRAINKAILAARGGDEELAQLPGTRYEVEALSQLFRSDDRPVRTLLDSAATEPEVERIATSGELAKYGFIHLATHGVIDENTPSRSAIILTQVGLPDPLEQVLNNKPVFDGRLSVREIQHDWKLKAELVTLSACETALGRDLGGEGFIGFTQALLISGARSVCLSLWKVDDTATALLMQRFYANMLGRRSGLGAPLPKAEALREAKFWLRGLRRAEVLALIAKLSGGIERGKSAKGRAPAAIPGDNDNDRPYEAPHYWAAFVIAGDSD